MRCPSSKFQSWRLAQRQLPACAHSEELLSMASHSADLLRAACAAYAHEHHSDCDRPSQLGRPRHCQHDSSDTTATHLPRRSGRGWKSPSITDSTTTPEIQPRQSTPRARDIAYNRRSNAAPRRHHSSSGIADQVISVAKCCCSWSYGVLQGACNVTWVPVGALG